MPSRAVAVGARRRRWIASRAAMRISQPPERPVPAIRAKLAIRDDEGILRRVLGLGGIGQDVPADRDDGVSLALDERAECVPVPAQHGIHQLAVGQRRCCFRMVERHGVRRASFLRWAVGPGGSILPRRTRPTSGPMVNPSVAMVLLLLSNEARRSAASRQATGSHPAVRRYSRWSRLDLRVEADPELVEGPQQEATPAALAVGTIELMADRRRPRSSGSGSGGIGTGALRTRRSRSRSSSGRSRKSRTTPPAQRLAPDAEPGVPERVGHATAHRLAEGHGEPRRRVDGATPAVGERQTVELGEGAEELGGQLVERLRSTVELRGDAAAVVVDGVVAAPQDPVVGREPEIVELVVRVGQALATAPADGTRAGPRSAARIRGRSRRPARTATRADAASRNMPRSRPRRSPRRRSRHRPC